MDTYGMETEIRALINAWEGRKLNWQDMETAAHLAKERRKARSVIKVRKSGKLNWQDMEADTKLAEDWRNYLSHPPDYESYPPRWI